MNEVVSFDGVACVMAGDVMAVLWKNPARLARVRWLGAQMDQMAASMPKDFIVLMFILPSSSPPDAESRAVAKVMVTKHAKAMRRMITVPLGDAFWSNIVRTIMRGMLLITGQSANHDVVANERLALEKVRQSSSADTPSTSVLVPLIDELFRTLDAKRTGPSAAETETTA